MARRTDSPFSGVQETDVAIYMARGGKEKWTHEDMCEHLAKDICGVSKDAGSDDEWKKFVAQMNTRRAVVKAKLTDTYDRQPTRGRNGEAPKVYTEKELEARRRQAKNLREALGVPILRREQLPKLVGSTRGTRMEVSKEQVQEFRNLLGIV